ncbi:alkaline phosphatase [Pseudoalteromonas sp. APC 3358]|uniref:alkaline phosphatase n=1 Tax=unclassified Pseudoalteromonas TaxID=194690 RepID=UPI0003F649D0|nr:MULTISPECIES: alkaline phosphatase [unclassified Pseudoalteromonas]MBH0047622.1 alkaline phosphatase [Pseudoalteromonas sp. NZS11_1]MDN3384530.1 alkaline phosphatase [Pseudoalteromonas sp. APC 3358]
MKIKKVAAAIALTFAFSAVSHADVLPQSQKDSSWYSAAQTKLTTKTAQAQATQATKAKNVILFVGDGMGISTLTAARILQGQRNNQSGEEGYLSFEEFPYSAQVKTYNVDAQTPDSAGTMTAIISGVKTDVGVIGVDEDIERGVCSTVAGNELLTATELAEIKGLSTGIISTARITHATPAATYAKSADRNWEDVSDMPEDAVTGGCEDIASQLVNFEKNLEARFVGTDVDGLDFVMGGGRRHFLPKDETANSTDAVSAIEGDRTDERNLVTEWQTQYPDATYVMDQTGFDAIADDATKVFGLFNESHMQYEADRANDVAGEPSLTDMTTKAIEVLGKNDNGFFLTVESGRIDHAHHAGNAYNALNDTIEFAKAVQAAVDNTNPEETLILVTADHSHVFTIAGYPKRGNPILGQVVAVGATTPSLAADDMPYTTVGYANGLGFRNLGDETDADASYTSAAVAGRVELNGVDTTTPGFHQEATVPMGSETHAGEDISLHAKGPGAQLAQGVIEQNVVFHLINQALELTQQ